MREIKLKVFNFKELHPFTQTQLIANYRQETVKPIIEKALNAAFAKKDPELYVHKLCLTDSAQTSTIYLNDGNITPFVKKWEKFNQDHLMENLNMHFFLDYEMADPEEGDEFGIDIRASTATASYKQECVTYVNKVLKQTVNYIKSQVFKELDICSDEAISEKLGQFEYFIDGTVYDEYSLKRQ